MRHDWQSRNPTSLAVESEAVFLHFVCFPNIWCFWLSSISGCLDIRSSASHHSMMWHHIVVSCDHRMRQKQSRSDRAGARQRYQRFWFYVGGSVDPALLGSSVSAFTATKMQLLSRVPFRMCHIKNIHYTQVLQYLELTLTTTTESFC